MRSATLRLFTSLFLLPVFAAPLLLLLHHILYADVFFNDIPIVAALWLLIFLAVHFLFSNIGVSRFRKLDGLGWDFLQVNDLPRVARVFAQIEALFGGGLLVRGKKKELEKVVLRRFFPLYRGKINDAAFRARLLTCLHANIRRDEAFEALKIYLLNQPRLTSALVDLAETLHELRPEDGAVIAFMTHHYLEDKQRHYRAEYFYQRSLARRDDDSAGRIVELCFERAIKQNRRDIFAAWLYFRAYDLDEAAAFPRLTEQLYQTYVALKTVRTDDEVVERLGNIVEQLDMQEIEQWQERRREREEKKLSTKLARAGYLVRQQGVQFWDVIVRDRKYVYYTSGAVIFLLTIYFVIPDTLDAPAEQSAKVVASAIRESEAKFSLQVSALKSASGARREVARLSKEGLEAYLVKPSGRSRYYRIHVGKFPGKGEAEIKGNDLRQQKVIRDFFVVNYANPEEGGATP